MAKSRHAATAASQRAGIASRTKSTEVRSTNFHTSKRAAARRDPVNKPDPEQLPLRAAGDGVLDEWLEPDEATDVDQWLHEHGADVDDDSSR
ncbi:MAG: hypothetical protein HC807_01765 [Gammaproteobacteria bacterium]|nr:hypothetical protein [Gammaproteobacteria bacterium]